MDDILSPKSKELIDILTGLDIPRIPAEIIGFLLVSQPEGLTFDHVQKELGVSKAAVSTAMRYLEALEIVGYKTILGSRKKLICLKPAKIANYLKRRMSFFGRLTRSLQTIAEKHEENEFGQEIISVAALCLKLDVAVNEIIREWEGDSYERI